MSAAVAPVATQSALLARALEGNRDGGAADDVWAQRFARLEAFQHGIADLGDAVAVGEDAAIHARDSGGRHTSRRMVHPSVAVEAWADNLCRDHPGAFASSSTTSQLPEEATSGTVVLACDEETSISAPDVEDPSFFRISSPHRTRSASKRSAIRAPPQDMSVNGSKLRSGLAARAVEDSCRASRPYTGSVAELTSARGLGTSSVSTTPTPRTPAATHGDRGRRHSHSSSTPSGSTILQSASPDSTPQARQLSLDSRRVNTPAQQRSPCKTRMSPHASGKRPSSVSSQAREPTSNAMRKSGTATAGDRQSPLFVIRGTGLDVPGEPDGQLGQGLGALDGGRSVESCQSHPSARPPRPASQRRAPQQPLASSEHTPLHPQRRASAGGRTAQSEHRQTTCSSTVPGRNRTPQRHQSPIRWSSSASMVESNETPSCTQLWTQWRSVREDAQGLCMALKVTEQASEVGRSSTAPVQEPEAQTPAFNEQLSCESVGTSGTLAADPDCGRQGDEAGSRGNFKAQQRDQPHRTAAIAGPVADADFLQFLKRNRIDDALPFLRANGIATFSILLATSDAELRRLPVSQRVVQQLLRSLRTERGRRARVWEAASMGRWSPPVVGQAQPHQAAGVGLNDDAGQEGSLQLAETASGSSESTYKLAPQVASEDTDLQTTIRASWWGQGLDGTIADATGSLNGVSSGGGHDGNEVAARSVNAPLDARQLLIQQGFFSGDEDGGILSVPSFSTKRQMRIQELLRSLNITNGMEAARVKSRQARAFQHHVRTQGPVNSADRSSTADQAQPLSRAAPERRKSRSLLDLVSGPSGHQPLPNPDPLDTMLLERVLSCLPVVTAAVGHKEVCPICLEMPGPGEKLTTLPCCHLYHTECIREWLLHSRLCPLCKCTAVPSHLLSKR